MKGKISQVKEDRQGTELTSDVAAGTTVIEVEDVPELASATGTVAILFDVYGYTRDDAPDQESDEIDLDDDGDLDAGTITLDTPTVRDYPADTRVIQYPASDDRIAYVLLEDQEEEIAARVHWGTKLFDQIPTGTREDPEEAETVEVTFQGAEWVVTDLIGEEGPGITRGYAKAAGPFTVVENLVEPKVLATIPLEIPSTQHRVLLWYSALMDADDGTVAHLHLDDGDFDFPVGSYPLVTYYGNAAVPGPNRVMSMIPQFSLAGITTTVGSESSGSWEAPSLPAPILPYALEEPSVGLHIFRLCASRLSGIGNVTVSDVNVWATVI